MGDDSFEATVQLFRSDIARHASALSASSDLDGEDAEADRPQGRARSEPPRAVVPRMNPATSFALYAVHDILSECARELLSSAWARWRSTPPRSKRAAGGVIDESAALRAQVAALEVQLLEVRRSARASLLRAARDFSERADWGWFGKAHAALAAAVKPAEPVPNADSGHPSIFARRIRRITLRVPQCEPMALSVNEGLPVRDLCAWVRLNLLLGSDHNQPLRLILNGRVLDTSSAAALVDCGIEEGSFLSVGLGAGGRAMNTPSSAGEPAASPLRAVLRKWANACAPAFVQWRARVKEEKWCETQTHELLDEVEQLETEMAEIQAYFRARGSPVQ